MRLRMGVNIMRLFAHIWHRLTDPPSTITEPEQRRRMHLLLSVLTAIWLMSAFYLLTVLLQIRFMREEIRSGGPAAGLLLFHLAALASMAIAYFLGRRGHYSTSARILVPTVSSITFMEAMTFGGIGLINLPTAAIVLCSIFLSTWETVVAYAITLLGYLVFVPIGHVAAAWNPVDPIIVATAVGGVALAAAVLRARDFRQLEAQSAKLLADQEQVLEVRKMEAVGRLSAGMAHEFNNILMAMSANAQIIEGTAAGAALEGAKRIRVSTARVARVVEELLSLSEQQLLRPEISDIDAMMKEHESALNSSLRETTTLILRPAAKRALLNIDTELFFEAIRTFVCDAEKGISGPGTITIQSNKEDMLPSDELFFPGGSYCTLTISNGISPKPGSEESRAFEMSRRTGTGEMASIDLAAAHGIVRQSGGRIETKIDLELGATFVVVVPIYEEAATEGQDV